jgi:hypothetical protein
MADNFSLMNLAISALPDLLARKDEDGKILVVCNSSLPSASLSLPLVLSNKRSEIYLGLFRVVEMIR